LVEGGPGAARAAAESTHVVRRCAPPRGGEDRGHRGETSWPARHEEGPRAYHGSVCGSRAGERVPDPGELGGARPVTVELVYDPDCPNAAEARTNLRRALVEAGIATQGVEWKRSAGGTPARGAGFGSPTVLAGGRDAAGAQPSEAAGRRVHRVAGWRV